MSPKFSVAISGCAVGGLTLAAFLSKSSDIKVDLYETKAEVSTIGAAISIWKRPWEVLQELGFEEDVAKGGIPTPKDGAVRGLIFRKADQAEGRDFLPQMMPYRPTNLPRPVLLDILLSKLNPSTCTVHTSKNVSRYTISDPEGPITIRFTDGTTSTADILIGSDGVHSRVRAAMFPSDDRYTEPTWTGAFVYRSKCLQEDVRKVYPEHQGLAVPKIWCRKDKHVISYPFGNIISLTSFYTVPGGENSPYTDPWVLDTSEQEVIDHYQNFEPDLRSLLQCTDKP